MPPSPLNPSPMMRILPFGLSLALLLALTPPALAADDAPAPAHVDAGAIVWTPEAPFSDAVLLVNGAGAELRRAFSAGERIALDPTALDVPLADGVYLYTLVLRAPDEAIDQQVGSFEVADGRAVESDAMVAFHAGSGWIDGKLCVGLDCDSDPAAFQTMVLKENNVRLLFEDTSGIGSFPADDWEITINDTFNGGDNYFQVRNRTRDTNPFRVSGSAPTNALWVGTEGNVGLGIADPAIELHINDGDTPAVRFEQDGSGFPVYAWDVAGNETNFFVRDITGGSLLPFKIRPGSPTDRLTVNSVGVGIGTANATALLDVEGDALVSGDARIEGIAAPDRLVIAAPADLPSVPTDAVVDVDGFSRFRDRVRIAGQLDLDQNLVIQGNIIGRAQLNFVGDYGGSGTVIRVRDNVLNKNILYSYGNGNLLIGGTLIQTSDATVKENVVPVDPESILSGVAGLPMATWQYIDDEAGSVHLGPMAQDFHAAFGLGMNATTIASVDADGVALASVQALHARSEADRARIAELEAQNAALADRLARLEAILTGADDD